MNIIRFSAQCLLVAWIVAWPVTLELLAKDPKPKGESKAAKLLKLSNLSDLTDDDDEDAPLDAKQKYGTKIETSLIGDYTTFAGLTPIRVEGVGLVVGLHGTGGNPAPSGYRTALLEELKRRNVRSPNEILKSPDTALVYLRALLPPLLQKGDTIDVQVWIPDSAEATSLEGGWLMEAYLSEQAFVPGKGNLSGHHYVKVKGPVLTAAIGANKDQSPALLARGNVLGGGVVLRERELAIYLRNDFRSIRQAIRVADAISKRFHDFDKYGTQQPMAVAKNDQKVSLLVHPKYKNNFPRYLQVIRHLAFREKPEVMRLRLQRLKNELFEPETSEKAALQLEGIGKEAIPILKAGLASPLLECRFHAASALAYMGEPEGVPVLAEAAKTEPAFRVFAFAALSVVEDAEAHVALRNLMKESSMETRYGAFRALWVLDKNDPFIRGEQIKVLEGKTGYMLHELDTPGEPLVHLTTRTRPEVVLYGANQKLSVPLYLNAGKNLMVTAQAGAQTAKIRKFSLDEEDQVREVPLNLGDVIRAASELDATYPDIVQMLMQAAELKNIEGRFAHDALPEGGRVYERPVASQNGPSKATVKTRIGRDNQTPNLFPIDPNKEQKPPDGGDAETERDQGVMLNVPNEKPTTTAATAASRGSKSSPRGNAKPSEAAEKPRDGILPKWMTPRVRKFTPVEDQPNEPEPSLPRTTAKPAVDEEIGAQSEP